MVHAAPPELYPQCGGSGLAGEAALGFDDLPETALQDQVLAEQQTCGFGEKLPPPRMACLNKHLTIVFHRTFDLLSPSVTLFLGPNPSI